MEEKEELQVKFETQITQSDLMNFKIYHNYRSFSGILSLLFGLIMIFVCVFSMGKVNVTYSLMTGFFGIFFTVYTPIGMYLNVKKQMRTTPSFKDKVTYIIDDNGITLSQGETKETLPWTDVFRIKSTGKCIIIYITTVRANVIPYKDLESQMDTFLKIADKHLKPFQIKVKR